MNRLTFISVVGVEPTQVLPHMNLNHARLPISPHRGFPNPFTAFALVPEVGATIPPGEDRASHPQVGNTPQKTLLFPNQ